MFAAFLDSADCRLSAYVRCYQTPSAFLKESIENDTSQGVLGTQLCFPERRLHNYTRFSNLRAIPNVTCRHHLSTPSSIVTDTAERAPVWIVAGSTKRLLVAEGTKRLLDRFALTFFQSKIMCPARVRICLVADRRHEERIRPMRLSPRSYRQQYFHHHCLHSS